MPEFDGEREALHQICAVLDVRATVFVIHDPRGKLKVHRAKLSGLTQRFNCLHVSTPQFAKAPMWKAAPVLKSLAGVCTYRTKARL